jgi:threonine aldolase
MAPEALRAALAVPPNPHFGGPVAVTLSQLTELGAVYRPETVAALAGLAHERGLGVHMDGARFAAAVAALGISPADMTWRAGVDVMSFGGTKAGCIAAEAVVFFDKALARDFAAMRQMAGHTFSKSWFVAAQFAAYLEEGHWLALAGHANAMAARLAGHLRAAPGARLALAPDANQLFAILSAAADRSLRAAGAVYHPWSTAALPDGVRLAPGETFVRLVTSFQTTAADVDRFGEALAGA